MIDIQRHRRLRSSGLLRDMVAEANPRREGLILPLFIVKGTGVKKEIPSMPGTYHWSADMLLKQMPRWLDFGLNKFNLFGVGEEKTLNAEAACSSHSVVNETLRTLKGTFGSRIFVITDVCLCAYTTHGHCGLLKDREIDNDSSLEVLAAMAVSHASSGADMVAPSDMMDGRVRAIRQSLNEAGFSQLPLMSYSVKYASAYYGPFRDAADSAPEFGDRKTYQMDFRNRREALKEAASDEAEGADIIMVKPALAYLDIIREVRNSTLLPVACYNVSAEYAMVKAAALKGWIDEERIVRENFTAFVRSGADLILSYHSADAVEKNWIP